MLKHLSGESLRSRALRGTTITLGSTVFAQVMRLVSNLILTRLLFPEAFGLMALVTTFTAGLNMFSDLGIKPSITRSSRGEDPAFLNTAWTVQIIRGVILWLGACALAWPVAQFYGDDRILWLLPLVGLNALIGGFWSTKPLVLGRNLQLGRQTLIAMGTQVIGLSCMVGLALVWPTVGVLAASGLISSALGVWASHRLLPGTRNRLLLEREALRELVGFGRFIFLSTIIWFFASQGDKLFLGKMVSFTDLGIYNIAFFLATVPTMLAERVSNGILFPLYRHRSAGEDDDHGRNAKIRQARDLLIGGQMALFAIVAVLGAWFVDLLYDDRYTPAGPMLIILALCLMPKSVMVGGSAVLLAEGDSKRFSYLTLAGAIVDIAFLVGGFWLFGIFGVILSRGIAFLATYPLQQVFVARYGTYYPFRDAAFIAASLVVAAAVVWLNWDALAEFYRLSRAAAPAVTGSWAPTPVFAP